MTQSQRVLEALQRGPVCQVDFLAPNVIDGMAPITRLAARVEELRRRGHHIVNDGIRHKCSVYRLETALKTEEARQFVSPSPVVSDESWGATPTLGGHSGGEHLFDSSDTTAPRLALFDE